MQTILRYDGIEFTIWAEKSFESIVNEYFVVKDDLGDIHRKINICFCGICGCNDYKTDDFLITKKNYMDVEYKIYKEKSCAVINYISEEELYGRHVYRKLSENEYEVYSIDNSEKNGMQWVIRLIRELLLEMYIEDGFVPVHASGIDIYGGAVLFIGNKGSGKTTSMFSCATNEKCKVVSNDMVFLKVEEDGICVKGWPWCVTIGNELMAETQFKHLINNTISKVRFTPKEFEESMPCNWIWESRLKKVVFPKIVVGKRLEVKTLEKIVVQSRLINEGTEYTEIPILLKMKTIECDFNKVFDFIAENVEGIVIEGEFWKYKKEFISYM